MAIGFLGLAGAAFAAYMWLPDVLALFGFGIDKLRGTGLGKELLGISDDELIEQIQTESKRIGDEDALTVFQSDQILEQREAGRKSFERVPVELQQYLDISDLKQQIEALEAGGRTDPSNPKQSLGGAAPGLQDYTSAPTSAEALTAPVAPAAPGRPEIPAESGVADGAPPLLSDDEREDLRHLLIDAGLPSEETE